MERGGEGKGETNYLNDTQHYNATFNLHKEI